MVLIFSGLASIPRHETKKPRSLPAVTPNTHLSGFSLVRVRRSLVETRVVDAHLELPTGLRDDHRVGQPPRVVDLPYEASLKQLLDFFMDEVLPLNGLLPRLLLDWPGVGVDLQMVLDHLPRDPGHLRWLPCKHIRVSPEEGDEHEFLFAVQITRDTGSLSSIGPNLNGLHGDILSYRELHAGCWGRDALV
jgi:hypothetical protein